MRASWSTSASVSEKRSRSAGGRFSVRTDLPADVSAANVIFCSFEPRRRRRIAGLPAASIGLWT